MRVLITGAAGFIGSHLADKLTGDGHTVVGVDNWETGRQENVGDWPLITCDITDRQLFYAVANGDGLHRLWDAPDFVIHCAASYSDPNLWHRDTDTNVSGTINAINVARHHGARLVYFQTALPPISSYAISKIAGEQYIHLSKVPALIFRLANIYGPRNLSGPIPTFYKRLAAGESCTVVDTARDTVYIDDLVQLVTRAIDRGETGKYDVCSGTHYPIKQLYRAVAQAMPDQPEYQEPVELPRPDDDVPNMDLDPEPAALVFRWRTRTPLEHGIHRTVSWYAEHGVGDTYTHLKLKG